MKSFVESANLAIGRIYQNKIQQFAIKIIFIKINNKRLTQKGRYSKFNIKKDFISKDRKLMQILKF